MPDRVKLWGAAAGIFLLIILLMMYGNESPNTGDDAPTAGKGPVGGPQSFAEIPADLTYAIVERDIIPNIKRSLDVRISRLASESELSAIASRLQAADGKAYKRTFICYYLPGWEVGAGAWATTHYNPNLEVKILGLTIEQDRFLRSVSVDKPNRRIVGSWLYEEPPGGCRWTIYTESDTTFLETIYHDGSRGSCKLVERKSALGRRFDFVPDRGHGEYYLIDRTGDLQMRDGDGPFLTAKKLAF